MHVGHRQLGYDVGQHPGPAGDAGRVEASRVALPILLERAEGLVDGQDLAVDLTAEHERQVAGATLGLAQLLALVHVRQHQDRHPGGERQDGGKRDDRGLQRPDLDVFRPACPFHDIRSRCPGYRPPFTETRATGPTL